jgi:hypothetical protein
MSPSLKKKDKRAPIALKSSRIPSSWIRVVVSFLYEYSTFHIGAIIVSLIIIMFIDDLFKKYGLLLVMGVLMFILLYYLKKWFEKHNE